MKSPRFELMLLAALLLSAMAAFVWMQRWSIKAKAPKPDVAIQDGKTLDFSTGRAVVKDDAKQKAALEKALKEMESAAAGVTFRPAGTAQKKAEPATAPPKP